MSLSRLPLSLRPHDALEDVLQMPTHIVPLYDVIVYSSRYSHLVKYVAKKGEVLVTDGLPSDVGGIQLLPLFGGGRVPRDFVRAAMENEYDPWKPLCKPPGVHLVLRLVGGADDDAPGGVAGAAVGAAADGGGRPQSSNEKEETFDSVYQQHAGDAWVWKWSDAPKARRVSQSDLAEGAINIADFPSKPLAGVNHMANIFDTIF